MPPHIAEVTDDELYETMASHTIPHMTPASHILAEDNVAYVSQAGSSTPHVPVTYPRRTTSLMSHRQAAVPLT